MTEHEAQRDAVAAMLKLGQRVAVLEEKVAVLRSELAQLKGKKPKGSAKETTPTDDGRLSIVARGIEAAGRYF